MEYTTEDFNTEKILWGEYKPKTTKVHNPTIIAPTRIPGDGKRVFNGGILDASGNEIIDGRIWRGRPNKNNPINVLSLSNSKSVQSNCNKVGDYTYLGGFFGQYGHFLLESLCRVPLSEDERKSSSFIHLDLTGNGKNISYIDYSLNALGIKSTPILNTTSFTGTVSVPVPRVIMGSYVSKSQSRIYDCIKQYAIENIKNTKCYPKLYLSRSKLTRDPRRISNERKLEKYLSKNGFTICHMQEIPFERQVYLMSQAEVVVGFAGSAMHSIVFSDRNTKVIFLYKDKRIYENYVLCDKMLNRSSIYIDASDYTQANGWASTIYERKVGNTILEMVR